MENTVFGKLFDYLEINVEEMIDDSLRSTLETRALKKKEHSYFQNKYRRNKKGVNPIKTRRLIKRAIKVCYTDIEKLQKLEKVMRKRGEETKGSFFKQLQESIGLKDFDLSPIRAYDGNPQCETHTIPLESVNDVVLDMDSAYPVLPEELSSNTSLKVCGKEEYVEHIVETKPTHIPEAPYPTMNIYDKIRSNVQPSNYELSEINMNDLRPGKHTDNGNAISEEVIRKAKLALFDIDTTLFENAFDGLDSDYTLEQIEKED